MLGLGEAVGGLSSSLCVAGTVLGRGLSSTVGERRRAEPLYGPFTEEGLEVRCCSWSNRGLAGPLKSDGSSGEAVSSNIISNMEHLSIES